MPIWERYINFSLNSHAVTSIILSRSVCSHDSQFSRSALSNVSLPSRYPWNLRRSHSHTHTCSYLKSKLGPLDKLDSSLVSFHCDNHIEHAVGNNCLALKPHRNKFRAIFQISLLDISGQNLSLLVSLANFRGSQRQLGTRSLTRPKVPLGMYDSIYSGCNWLQETKI